MLDCVDSSTSKMNEHLGTAHMVPVVALCTLGIVSFRASYPTKNVAAAFFKQASAAFGYFLKNCHFRNCSAVEHSPKVSVFWDIELKACLERLQTTYLF